jgi:hypothetical protein
MEVFIHKKSYYFGYTSVSKIYRHFFPDRYGTNMAGHIPIEMPECVSSLPGSRMQAPWLQYAGSMAPERAYKKAPGRASSTPG